MPIVATPQSPTPMPKPQARPASMGCSRSRARRAHHEYPTTSNPIRIADETSSRHAEAHVAQVSGSVAACTGFSIVARLTETGSGLAVLRRRLGCTTRPEQPNVASAPLEAPRTDLLPVDSRHVADFCPHRLVGIDRPGRSDGG